MTRGATGLSEAHLQGKDKTIQFGNFKYFLGGDSTLGNLISAGIIPNKVYINMNRKPDGLIIKGKNTVIGVVEYKKPSAFKSDNQIQAAIDQALEVAEELDAKFVVATDGVNKSVWVNTKTQERILNIDGYELNVLFEYDGNIVKESLIKITRDIDNSISVSNNKIIETLVDPTPLAKEAWQYLFVGANATADEALYTFVELFVFKYLSDMKILTGKNNFYNFLDEYKKEDADEMLNYYVTIIRVKIKELFPESNDSDDRTTIINGSLFLTSEGKADKNRSNMFRDLLIMFKDFGELTKVNAEFKSRLFELFFKNDKEKDGLGQHFTPLKVVESMVDMVDIREGMRICDPTCGVGKFLLDAVARDNKKLQRYYPIINGKIEPQITIEGFDKGFNNKHASRTIILAKANMLIYFADLLKEYPSDDMAKQLSKLFNNTFHLKNTTLGTLGYIPNNNKKYDLILANPPYVATGNKAVKDEILKQGLDSTYSVGGLGLEALFMVWIVNALKENGTALVVIPDGLLNRTLDKNIREFILRECNLNAIISLPNKTFFSTTKKTYIISITKKDKLKSVQNTPVFTYLASSIGETLDSYRWSTEDNDLNQAVDLYKMFMGSPNAKEHYEQYERCKIIEVSDFEDNIATDWTIEKYWTEDEKIALGVKEKEETMTIGEFKERLTGVIGDLQGYVDLLSEVE